MNKVSRMTVQNRKELLRDTIKARTEGKLSDIDIFKLVNKLNINNQYTVVVTGDEDDFKNSLELVKTSYFVPVKEEFSGLVVKDLSYLGGQTQQGEVLIGDAQFVDTETIITHGERLYSGNLSHDSDIFNPNKVNAILKTTMKNYLKEDGTGRVFTIRYKIIIYIPK